MEEEIYFCSVHREWGKKGDDFPHTGCLNVQLQKGQMKEVLRRLLPFNLERQIAKAEARRRTPKENKMKKGIEFQQAENKGEFDAAEELQRAVAAITPKPPVLLSDLSSSDSEGESVAEVRPDRLSDISSDFKCELRDKVDKKRAHKVDLDETVSNSEPPAQRVRTSSPQKVKCPSPKKLDILPTRRQAPFLPRLFARPVNQTLARNNLMDSNKKLESQVKALQEEATLLRQKEADRKKWEADTKAILENAKDFEQEKQELERMKKELERERVLVSNIKNEMEEKARRSEQEKVVMMAEKQVLEERVMVLENENRSLMSRMDEKEKEVRQAVESATTQINRVGGLSHCVLHLEVLNNKVCRRSLETVNANDSLVCFSDANRQARCIHIDVTGHNLQIGAKNVRWPNEC